jgi:hypothetical protein
MTTIDKNIPIPKPRNSKFSALDLLEVGDSTTFPLTDYNTLGPSIKFRADRYGKRFTRRTEDTLVRVWRVA